MSPKRKKKRAAAKMRKWYRHAVTTCWICREGIAHSIRSHLLAGGRYPQMTKKEARRFRRAISKEYEVWPEFS